MDNSEPRIHISFSPAALSLVLEGLALLPLGRSRALYDALDHESRRQSEAWREQLVAAIRSDPVQPSDVDSSSAGAGT